MGKTNAFMRPRIGRSTPGLALIPVLLFAMVSPAVAKQSDIPHVHVLQPKGALVDEAFWTEVSAAEASAATELRRANVRKLLLTNACVACDLDGVDLSAAHLIGADLRQASLRGAQLVDVNLEGADLSASDLTRADFTGAFLTNAVMKEAVLNNVDFTAATLYNVNIVGASVQDLTLTDAQIWRTPLSVGGATPLDPATLPNLPAPQR